MEGVGRKVEGVEARIGAGIEAGTEAGTGREAGKLPHFSPLNQISNIMY